MQGAQFIQAELARRAYLDGFSEGLNGMLAIAFAFRNRVNAGWWGGNWVEVLKHHRDSSAYLQDANPNDIPDPRIFSFQTLLQEIDGIFTGSRPDDVTRPATSVLSTPAPPALYYAKLNEIDNEWFLENISRQPQIHPRIAQVGALTLFA